jgi:hypothetical protein
MMNCRFRELTRRNNKPAGRTLGRHHAVQLAHNFDADLVRPPLLAFDKEFLAALIKNQVHAAVSSIAPVSMTCKRAISGVVSR